MSDYSCPRCGYCTPRREYLKMHLYKRARPCKDNGGNIELSDEVKQQALASRAVLSHARISCPPMAPGRDAPVVNYNMQQTINIVNQITHMVGPLERINRYASYTNKPIADFDTFVGAKYASEVQRMKNGHERYLRGNDFLQLVDDISKPTTIEECNLVYDSQTNKVCIYEDGSWIEFIYQSGLVRIVETLKDKLLDDYELKLVHKINERTTDPREKAECREYLSELYGLLAAFHLEPRVKNMPNNEIMCDSEERSFDRDESMAIEESCWKLYRDIKARQPTSAVNRMMRDIREIVKRNSDACIRQVNRSILQLFHTDHNFREIVTAMPNLGLVEAA